MIKSEVKIGVVTVSDTRTLATDASGRAAITALNAQGFEWLESRIVPDEITEIQKAISELCESCRAIFTTGGTGFSPRDVTPEATGPLLDKRADSLMELLRNAGLKSTPFSHLSRGVAGVRGTSLVVNLPGSPGGVQDGLEALRTLLPAILAELMKQ